MITMCSTDTVQLAEEQQFLSFLLPPDTRGMLSTQQLTEILSLSANQITPVPAVPLEVMGVCNWRGEILWLLDLGYLLGKQPLFRQGHRQTHYSAIVVQFQNHAVGLVVDQVSQMHTYDPSQVQLLQPPQSPFKLPACLQGYWLTPQGEPIWVLDCAALIQHLL